jgi:hypothetical protein
MYMSAAILSELWPNVWNVAFRTSPLQHGELLAEHEVLKDKIAADAKEANKRAEPQKKRVEHGLALYQITGGEVAASYWFCGRREV